MARSRGSSSHKKNRRAAALNNQLELVKIIESNLNGDLDLLSNSMNHMLLLNRKHRLNLRSSLKTFVCRGCSNPLISSNSRVRIKYGQVVKTCLSCGYVRRFGGGPKYHRK